MKKTLYARLDIKTVWLLPIAYVFCFKLHSFVPPQLYLSLNNNIIHRSVHISKL